MALQTSGPISMQDIAAEFNLPLPQSIAQLASAAGLGTLPVSLTDFYGLSALEDMDWSLFQGVDETGSKNLVELAAYTAEGRYFLVSSLSTIRWFDAGEGNNWDWEAFKAATPVSDGQDINDDDGINKGGIVSDPTGQLIICSSSSTLDLYKANLTVPYDVTTITPFNTLTFIRDYFSTEGGSIKPLFPPNLGSYSLSWGDRGNLFTYLWRGDNGSGSVIVTVDCPVAYELPDNPPVSSIKFLEIPERPEISTFEQSGFTWSRTGAKAYYSKLLYPSDTPTRVFELSFSVPYDINSFNNFRVLTNFTFDGQFSNSITNTKTHAGGFLRNDIQDEVWTLNFGGGYTRYTY